MTCERNPNRKGFKCEASFVIIFILALPRMHCYCFQYSSCQNKSDWKDHIFSQETCKAKKKDHTNYLVHYVKTKTVKNHS